MTAESKLRSRTVKKLPEMERVGLDRTYSERTPYT